MTARSHGPMACAARRRRRGSSRRSPPGRTPPRRSSRRARPADRGTGRARRSASRCGRRSTPDGRRAAAAAAVRSRPARARPAPTAAPREGNRPTATRDQSERTGCRAAGGERRAAGGHQHEAHQAEAAIDEDDGRGERLRAGRPRRVADADDVAADVARQEVVEEERDEVRAGEMVGRDVHILRIEQQLPAPDAGHHGERVDRERDEQPGDRGGARTRPQRSTSMREKRIHRRTTLTVSLTATRTWPALYYDSVRKSPHLCAF